MCPPQGKSLSEFLRQSELRTTLPRVRRRQIEAPGKKTALAWTIFFSLYPQGFASGFLKAADRECTPHPSRGQPCLVANLGQERARNGMVGQCHFSAAINHDVEMFRSH